MRQLPRKISKRLPGKIVCLEKNLAKSTHISNALDREMLLTRTFHAKAIIILLSIIVKYSVSMEAASSSFPICFFLDAKTMEISTSNDKNT